MMNIGTIKELIKASPIYREMFFVFYLKEKLLMRFRPKYFAEFQEDLKIRQLIGAVRTFVDIGANDGYHSSNSFYWALHGANGVCFEPIPSTYGRLERLYCFNHRVVCRNVAVSENDGEGMMVSLGDQSFIPETQDQCHRALHKERHAGAKGTCKVKLLTFDAAMRGLSLPAVIDLLTVDVEGHELRVLRSIPFDVYRFRAIIVETHLLDESGQYVWRHRDLDTIEALLAAKGYLRSLQTRANTIYTEGPIQKAFAHSGNAKRTLMNLDVLE
jgi:FkbM family methyltransferase